MAHPGLSYTTERFTAEITAKDYIANFRRADYFIKLCRQCGNYGKRYGCPPFDDDPTLLMGKYQNMDIGRSNHIHCTARICVLRKPISYAQNGIGILQ